MAPRPPFQGIGAKANARPRTVTWLQEAAGYAGSNRLLENLVSAVEGTVDGKDLHVVGAVKPEYAVLMYLGALVK